MRRKGSTPAPGSRSPRRWQSRRLGCTGSTRIYQAAAALAHTDRACAAHGLVDQLRIMSVAAGATPDWTTLVVTGPVEVDSAPERARFEWTASVTVRGVGIVDGQPRLDLNYAEDSSAETDMNVVCTGQGDFVEVQGTAEREPFSRDLLNQLLDLAVAGCGQLTELQLAALSRPI